MKKTIAMAVGFAMLALSTASFAEEQAPSAEQKQAEEICSKKGLAGTLLQECVKNEQAKLEEAKKAEQK